MAQNDVADLDDGAPPAPSEDTDDVAALVAAAGAFLGWEGAEFLLAPTNRRVSTVVRRWVAADQDRSLSGGPTCPEWVTELPSKVWEHERMVWRAAVDGGEAAAVVVPVRHQGDVVGVLAYHGRAMTEPDEPRVGMIEAIAHVLGRAGTLDPTPPVSVPATADGLHQAFALVDVFAFTVRVHDDGRLEWLYFGPNSGAVFGQPLSDHEALPDLIRRHAHLEDLVTAGEFLNAVVTGRPTEVEVRLSGGDGTTRWVSWRALPRRTDAGLFVDGVATDVSARHSLGRSRRELAEAREQYSRELDLRRQHALVVRDANDNVLQRLFAAGLRLQMLQRRLDDVEAHAASAIAFQLDQAASDLRELILDLNEVIAERAEPEAAAAS